MKPPKLPLTGTCQCAAVAVEISAPPLMTAACHCTSCQKMSGSAFSLTAMIPGDAFSVTRGQPVIGGLKGPQLHHHFCPDCMSWMFTRIEGVSAFINVRPSLFDDHAWFSPFIETMTREKLPWAHTPARHHFDEYPAMDDMQELIAEFAAAE